MNTRKWKRGFGGALLTILAAWVLAAAPAAAEPAADAIVLTLTERVEVDSDEVLLGQMAAISGALTEPMVKMRGIAIGRAPQAGQARTISRDYILLRLRQSGFDPDGIVIAAPESITLVRRAVTISSSDIEMMVREYVMANPPFSGADLTITAVRVPGDVVLPTGDVRHEIQYQPQARPSGLLPVSIFFSSAGSPVKRVMATVSVVMMKDVPVTRHPIARYQMIQAEDLMMQPMDVTGLPDNTVFAYEDIEGRRARRSIGPHRILRLDQIEFPPAVKRGDRVLIVAESAGLRITALGEVQTNGKIGERVKVVNLDSNKTLFARVIDARIVQVQF
jgi:flagella basal body P-ring formation protein FlgA